MLLKTDIPQLTKSPRYQLTPSLPDLKGQLASFFEDYNLDLNPDFQRPREWNAIQNRRWVEYLLRGGCHHTEILFNCPGWQGNDERQEMVLVDGQQRLKAVLDFLSDGFRVFQGLKGVKEGHLASEIAKPALGRARLILQINDLLKRSQVLDWYLELNEGHIAHSDEELERVRLLRAAERD